VLGDLTKVQALLTVAKRYVITDAGWNLLDFAAQTRDLTSASLVFHTLPIQGYATIDGQDANMINPGYIRSIVQATFYPRAGVPRRPAGATAGEAAEAPGKTTVDVFNGGYTTGLAGRVSAALGRAGYRAGQVADTSVRQTTTVLYGARASGNAGKIAARFGVTAVAGASVAAGHVQILLGAGATMADIGSPAPPAPPTVIPTAGPQGGAVSARNGIPCVN